MNDEALIFAILLLLAFWFIAVAIYCVTHSLGWHSFWSQRAHKVLGDEFDVRWNTGRAV